MTVNELCVIFGHDRILFTQITHRKKVKMPKRKVQSVTPDACWSVLDRYLEDICPHDFTLPTINSETELRLLLQQAWTQFKYNATITVYANLHIKTITCPCWGMQNPEQ